MNLIDKFIDSKGAFFVYDRNIYLPHPLGREGSFFEHSLRRYCEAEELKHRFQGNFKNTNRFINNAVVPLLSKNNLANKNEANGGFESISSKYQPVGFGKHFCNYFRRDKSGELEINSVRFKKVSQRPRQVLSLNQSNQKARGISVEQNRRDWTISKKLNPFFMENNSYERFFFKDIWISMDLKDRGSKIKISKPRVKKHYRHPFVFSGTKICFNGDKRWKRLGIDFGTQDIGIKLLRDIDRAFYETETNLIDGYKQGVSPVINLNQTNFPTEYRGRK